LNSVKKEGDRREKVEELEVGEVNEAVTQRAGHEVRIFA